MPTALITGITGQDGGYLAERLLGDGWRVAGAVRAGEVLPPDLRPLAGRLDVFELDLLDDRAVQESVERTRPDSVFNLAGVSSVAASWDDPVTTTRVNAVAVATLLEACWRQQVATGHPVRVVQASSAEMFAGAGAVPQAEDTPIRPTSPYGASKAFAHHLVGVFRARGLHAVSAILYNHESPRRPTSFVTRKITSGVAAIAEGAADELVLGSLDARRDWGWAPDYVDAMVLASAHPEPGDYVIATGVSHSVADFVRTAFASAGISDWERYVRSDAALQRPVDAVDLRGDAERARRVLGWSATVTFEEVVGRMVAHDRLLLQR